MGMDGEYAADMFANDKGYGFWIIMGLQKGLKNRWVGFEEESCNLRIKKLKESGPTNIEQDYEEENNDDQQS